MIRPIHTLLLLVFVGLPSWGQSCSKAAGTPVDMQVQLMMADPVTSDKNSDTHGFDTAGNDSKRSNGSAVRNSFDVSQQVQVELQDGFGTRIQEHQPTEEGKVSFRVCSLATYRLRVTGSAIEEATAEDLEPARGDRIVNISLHRKGDKTNERPGGLVAMGRLKIPRKAVKQLKKGNDALAAEKWTEAREAYKKAIDAYPQYDQAYNNLGVALMQLGDASGGKAAFEKAVTINGHFARALSNLARIAVNDRQYSKALELTEQSLGVEPFNPRTLTLGTEAAYLAGDYRNSVSFARTLHSLPHPGMGVAHYFCAKSLEKQGLVSQAIVEYETFLREDPTDPNARYAQLAVAELKASSQEQTN